MSSEPSRDARNSHPAWSPGGTPSDRQLLETFAHRRGEAAEAAFEALVRRHGPMVLRTCRQALGDGSGADDAFQATFLVLACRAQAACTSRSLCDWLFGVARRVVDEARGGPDGPGGGSRALAGWDELHREIARLPERYRLPVLLCDLEGLTPPEAAARLQWPLDAVDGRLSRARARLESRLARRGLDSPAISPPPPPLPLPEKLADSAVGIVRGTTAREPAVAVASSAEVASLAYPVIRALGLAKVKAAACVILAAVVLSLGAGFGAHCLMADRAPPAGPPACAKPHPKKHARPHPDPRHRPGRRGPAGPPAAKVVTPGPTAKGPAAK